MDCTNYIGLCDLEHFWASVYLQIIMFRRISETVPFILASADERMQAILYICRDWAFNTILNESYTDVFFSVLLWNRDDDLMPYKIFL